MGSEAYYSSRGLVDNTFNNITGKPGQYGVFGMAEGHFMKKAFIMQTKIVGLILALVLFLLVIGLVFPKALNANEKLHAARCKFVPFGCDEGDKGTGTEESDAEVFKKEFKERYEDARKKTNDVQLKTFSDAKDFVKKTECRVFWERDEETVYLLKSSSNGGSYYLHIRDGGTGRNRDDYYVKVNNQEPSEIISSVKNEGYNYDNLVMVKDYLSEQQKLEMEKGMEVSSPLPSLGYMDKICRNPEMKKSPYAPDFDSGCCEIFNYIQCIEENCGDSQKCNMRAESCDVTDNEPEKQEKTKFEKEFNSATKDEDKETKMAFSGFEGAEGMMKKVKCVAQTKKSGEDVFLLQSEVDNKPYYMLHIKEHEANTVRSDYFAVIKQGQDSDDLVALVLKKTYGADTHILLGDVPDDTAKPIPTLGFAYKVCRNEGMQKMPTTPNLEYGEYCKIYENIEKAENNCG